MPAAAAHEESKTSNAAAPCMPPKLREFETDESRTFHIQTPSRILAQIGRRREAQEGFYHQLPASATVCHHEHEILSPVMFAYPLQFVCENDQSLWFY